MIETRFKQTEVGAIPEDWEVKKLGEILYFKNGLNTNKENFGFGTPIVNYTDVYKNRCLYKSDIKGMVNVSNSEIARFKVKKGDIFFTRTSETPDEVGLSSIIIDNVTNCVFSGFILRARRFNDSLLDLYCKYCFSTKYFRIRVINSCTYTTRALTNGNVLSNISIVLPPLPEQTRIAAALTSIDNLITSLSALKEKKKQLKQGTMQQLLTGKRRLPGFSGTWVEKKLGEICEFGNGYTPSKEVASFWTNGTIPWFRMEDIRTNGRVLSDSIQHITKIAVKGQLFPSNSIIISTTATIGEHALIIVDSLANQQFTNLKIRKSLSKSISIDWLFHYCFVLGEWCRNNINEGGLAAVNMDDFSSHEMIMPPTFSEQTAIANVLTAMDNEIAALEAKRAKYEAIKQGMMQQLLTGRVRLCALHSGHCETQTNDKIASQSPQ